MKNMNTRTIATAKEESLAMSEPQIAVGEPQRSARRSIAAAHPAAGRTADAHHAHHAHRAPARPARNLSLTLREWHRRAGLFAFVFMAWLGVSGVLLNQSASWGFDAVHVRWSWLMALYGLHAQPPHDGYLAAGDHWLATTPDATLLDGKPLSPAIPNPIGFGATSGVVPPVLAVATADSLVLLKPDGSRLDELRAPMLPVGHILRIGVTSSGALALDGGGTLYQSADGETWSALPANAAVHWSQPEPLSSAQRAATLPYARPSVPLEQVLIDAHSGRLFGRYGPYVIDAAGLAALALSISGIWMMWRTRQNRRRYA